jgi:hypothetical protein
MVGHELPGSIAAADFQQAGQHQGDAYPACRNQYAGAAPGAACGVHACGVLTGQNQCMGTMDAMVLDLHFVFTVRSVDRIERKVENSVEQPYPEHDENIA